MANESILPMHDRFGTADPAAIEVARSRIRLWVEAMESDTYYKCESALVQPDNGLGVCRYCALGLAMKVYEDATDRLCGDDWGGSSLPRYVTIWYGFRYDDPYVVGPGWQYGDTFELRTVIGLNDANHMRLPEIAKYVRDTYLGGEGRPIG